MPRDIRVIGLDLDNTTLNSQKEITPRVRQAIERAIEAGIVVLPATGRPLSSVSAAFLEIPGVRYVLTSNGARVYDRQAGGVLYQNCFTTPQALDILEMSEGFSAATSAYIDGVAYMEPLDFENLPGTFTPEVVGYMRKARTQVPSLRRQIEQAGDGVEKFSLFFWDMDERQRAAQAYRDAGSCSVTSSMGSNLELNTPSCNKGVALLALAARLGYTQQQVMAVGDSTNDLEMLRAVGYAVAMGNSHPKVLAAAHAVTATADEDGVAKAIEAVIPGAE